MVKNTKAREWLKGRFHWEEDRIMVEELWATGK